MSASEIKKFIIIGMPRSGSTLLRTGLDQHPSVVCYQEVFHPVAKQRENAHHIFFRGEKVVYDPDKDDAISFLQEKLFVDHGPDVSAVGCKVFAHIAKSRGTKQLFSRLKQENDVHVIHIQRKNYFDMLVSLRLAEATGSWVNVGGDFDDNTKIFINPEEALKYLEKVSEANDFFRGFFVERALRITYDDLVKNYEDTMSKIYRFLEVPEFIPEKIVHKQNKVNHSERISNFSELSKYLSNTPFAHLLECG